VRRKDGGRRKRKIRDSGVNYNVYADRRALDRPWDSTIAAHQCADEWREIEGRPYPAAELFNRARGSLRSQSFEAGLITPSLIYAQSGFLRPACGHAEDTRRVHLHVYAADLARSPGWTWLGRERQKDSDRG